LGAGSRGRTIASGASLQSDSPLVVDAALSERRQMGAGAATAKKR
jgi:hypothetical protein